MRSNSKLVLAVLLGALLLTAVASASASAALCTKHAGSGKFLICANGHAIEETATITAPATLTSTFTLGLPSQWQGTIVCTGVGDTSAFNVHGLTQSATRSSKLEISGCALQGNLAKKCKIPVTWLTNSVVGRFASLESMPMAPEFGTTFMEFHLENNGAETCPAVFRGLRSISGEYECKLQTSTVEAVEHELICATSAAHKLRTEGEEDPLHYTQMISLGGTRAGQKFSVYEG
jgi:hypothetical protein